MKKIAAGILAFIVLLALGARIEKRRERASDEYIRNRVLKLINPKVGQCSAIEVRAPSGHVYTLSAAHCATLAENEYINAEAEDGAVKLIKVIRVDKEHDLMILEAFDKKSINIAKTEKEYEKVHTLTHGAGKPTYRTDGYLLDIEDVEVLDTHTPIEECQDLRVSMFGAVCIKKEHVVYSTAQVVGGSSGGAVLNEAGELVGIVSCGDDHFSGFVLLSDIQEDMKNL